MARACRAGRLVTLVITDVLGDPLDIIASGPTVRRQRHSAAGALAILERYRARDGGHFLLRVRLSAQQNRAAPRQAPACQVTNLVIGNNATAVDAAGSEAERLGYSHAMTSAPASEGPAEEVGRHLAGLAVSMKSRPGPNCLISGGEPVVKLPDATVRGLGGRNQQLALAALESLERHAMYRNRLALRRHRR